MHPLLSTIDVISDAHDQLDHLAKVIAYLNSIQVSMVVHCGDWISPFTLSHYAELQAPIFSVFGNNDGDKFRMLRYAERLNLKVVFEDQKLIFSHLEKRIAVYHGDYEEIVNALVKCGDYDVVFHGHTHRPKVEKVGNVVSLNPGTLVDFTSKQFKGRLSVCMMRIPMKEELCG